MGRIRYDSARLKIKAKLYKAGIYGTGWPAEYGGLPGPTDPWSDFILIDELGRVGAGGIFVHLFPLEIALQCIVDAGSKEIKDKICRDVITGKKSICFAHGEPNGGSDLANAIITTAVRDGDVYVVNGSKTFISSAMNADYITTGVRTGEKGATGISILLIESNMDGVKMTRLATTGLLCSDSVLVEFENVRVPVTNLIGKENEGYSRIMTALNRERLKMATLVNRFSRVCLEDALEYAKGRQTFGKPLIEHQVIRHKMAEMERAIQATHGMICVVNDRKLSDPEDGSIEGLIALLKVQATKSFEFCAREAAHIVGHLSLLRGGPGGRIERLNREVRTFAIGGMSEEVLLNYALSKAGLGSFENAC